MDPAGPRRLAARRASDSRKVVYVDGYGARLALVGLNGRDGMLLPHGSGADEESDRPGRLSCPTFSFDARRIAYVRTYDVLSEDGSRNELDVADVRGPKVSGRILTRQDVADQSGGSLGSDAEQSVTRYVGW